MHLEIDISFSCTEVDRDDAETSAFSGRVTADGRHITIDTDGRDLFEGANRASVRVLRAFAEDLASRGVSATVADAEGEVLSLGAIDAPVVQRVVTRSKHIRVGSLKGAAKSMLTSSKSEDDDPLMLPPVTPWPLVPTFNRRIRKHVTTTHGAPGSGRPRLVLVKDDSESGPGPVLEFNLVGERTVIGSDDSCDLQLSGLDSVHAEISHDEFDEYVLSRSGEAGGSVSRSVDEQVMLRTGSRIDMGPWRLVFIREEFADHGRPFGGRQGGEFAFQKPQYNPYVGRLEHNN